MYRKVAVTLFFIVSIFLIFNSTPSYASEEGERPQFVEGEILVKLTPDASLAQFNRFNRRFRVRTLHRYTLIRLVHLKLPASLSVEKAITLFQRQSFVEYAVPNNIYYLDQTFPNDTDFSNLWGLHNTGQTGGTADADIDAPEAWDITTGDDSVVIAVIDSGMDLDHEDLAANLWVNPGEIAGNGIDDDGNGYVDDVNGWDFSANDNDPSPAGGACGGHGTHTAGTIGAVGNNGVGVAGVNWNVKIMPLKAFRPALLIFCSANDADLIEAIEYHTMMGVRISSNSWGGGAFSQATFEAIRASNSVFVAAAGNGGADGVGDNNDATPHYPSSYELDNIIAVAATDHNDNRASFSNYGPTSVDLGAPGVNIYSTLINGYGSFSGTSMATPHVAGAAGLLLAQDPNLTINEVKWRILNGSDDVNLPVLTEGRLNAYNTLAFGLSLPAVTIEITPLGPTDVHAGDLVSVEISVTNNDTVAHTVTGKVYTRLDDGREFPVDEKTGTLAPGATFTTTLSDSVPPNLAPGRTFRVFAQAETAVSFDEDWVEYEVIP